MHSYVKAATSVRIEEDENPASSASQLSQPTLPANPASQSVIGKQPIFRETASWISACSGSSLDDKPERVVLKDNKG
jgi:hypothetical protein